MSVGARFSFISEKIGKETDLFLLFSFSPPPLLVELHADENYSMIILLDTSSRRIRRRFNLWKRKSEEVGVIPDAVALPI